MIRLDILGPGSASDGRDEPLDLSGLPLALLGYLAVTARPIERDELATLFWPGSEPARRRQSLRQALSRIRSAVPDEVFESDGATIGIDPTQVQTDREEFLEELSAGRVDNAVALWGGILLEGFRREGAWELGEWLERERTRLRDALVEAVLEYDVHSDADEVPMLRAAHRALPLEQRVTLRYAAALIRAGREAEALPLVPLEDEQDPRVPWDDMLQKARDAQAASIREHAAAPERSSGAAGAPGPGSEGGEDRSVWRRLLSPPVLGAAAFLIVGFVGLDAVANFGESAVNPTPGTALFCSDRAADADGRQQLYRMDVTGEGKHRLTRSTVCGARFLNRTMVAGITDRSDGRRLRALSPDPAGTSNAEWIFEPTPELDTLFGVENLDVRPDPVDPIVAFAAHSASDTIRDVFVWMPRTGRLTRVTRHPAEDDHVRIAPDGRIVLRTERSGGSDIMVWSEDTGVRPLVTGPGWDRDPQLRGDTLLFLRGRGVGDVDGNIDIYRLDLATGEETRLTDNDWNDYNFEWSADGRYICWQSEESGHFEMDVVVQDLVTGERWTIAGGPGRQSECQWDPESRGVYYSAWEAAGPEIYYAPLSGEAHINLSRYPGLDGGLSVFPDALADSDGGT